jgi:WD40 repeat protein
MRGERRARLQQRACCASILTLLLVCGCQTSTSADSKKMNLRLVAEYKQNQLEDLSADGKLMLLYRTSTPMRTYTSRPGKGVTADQPDAYDDVLRLVELESGRERSHIKAQFFPDLIQFIPGTERVFYRGPKQGRELTWQLELWDTAAQKVETCSSESASGLRAVALLDQQYGLAVQLLADEGDFLTRLSLRDCTRSIIGSVDPTYSKGRIWGKLAVSPDKHFVAYTLHSRAIIWNVVQNRLARTLTTTTPDLFFGRELAYTPDGKILIISATNRPLGGTDKKDSLLLYDTSNYQLLRLLPVPVISAMAISPDSRIVAIGSKEHQKAFLSIKEEAFVSLYDLASGKALSRASHSRVTAQRSDPFVAQINRLIFTPDGKYLLSSTYDTRVWRIEAADN